MQLIDFLKVLLKMELFFCKNNNNVQKGLYKTIKIVINWIWLEQNQAEKKNNSEFDLMRERNSCKYLLKWAAINGS